MAALHLFHVALEDIAKHNGITKYEIRFGGDYATTDGYVGTITEAQIILENKTIPLIIKSCGGNDNVRNVLPIDLIFKREIYMYEIIFPLFRQIEADRGLTPSQFAPKLYKAIMSKDVDALILRNLKEAGFSIHDRKTQLDDNHVKLSIEQYARLHAISFALKGQDSLRFQNVTECMDDLLIKCLESSGYMTIFINQMKRAATSLDSNMDKEAIRTFEALISDTKSFFLGLPKMVDKYSVILHGDCWKNNILFKYSDKNNPSKPTDVRFIDFQVSRIGSPMLDFINFFYSSASKDVIDNADHYLKVYYDCLSKSLHNLGINPEKIYPFSIMMEHYKKFARLGLVYRLSTLMVLLSDEEQRKSIPDILEMGGTVENVFDYNVPDDNAFRVLNRHSIIHFVKNKLI